VTIEIQGLVKSFGETEVLRGLDLAVGAGEVVALLGPNGAGKTTTIDILTTLLSADAGTAFVAGYDVATQPDEVRRTISVTGQSAAVDGLLTGRENLVMMGRLRGQTPRIATDAAAQALENFGLDAAADRRAGTYSGGMRRRLDLALGLIANAAVLILDEPTTGLDTRSRTWLWSQVRAAAANGATVLVTTQYLEEADQLADRVVVLDGGIAVANDTPEALKASVAAPRLEFTGPNGDVIATHHTNATVGEVRALLASAPIDATVTLRQPTLDDVFLELTTEVTV
jgi:ABC-2 type transport system ATP-binding protein